MSEPKHSFLHELFLKHAHEVSAFIRGRWPREQDVDDIMQESFLRLSQVPNPETILNPRAFLFTTASNMAVDRHRRRKTRERYIEPDADLENLANDYLSPERHSEAHEALERFTGWLDELPEMHRHAFVLYRIEGCSHAEIAMRLGISMSTSERYVKHAMHHIGVRLSAMQA
ncbi:MAG: sigma-70 family RNA polymerase sigma factor [Methylobacter sp.]|jgi:RNA polymerase sigma-70 factor (ECF subfamily)